MKDEDFMDAYAKAAKEKKVPRIDLAKSKDWPMVSNMLQEVAKNHLAGKPYSSIRRSSTSQPDLHLARSGKSGREALKDVFVIDTSPFPGETAMMADLVLPDHTYLERTQDTPHLSVSRAIR